MDGEELCEHLLEQFQASQGTTSLQEGTVLLLRQLLKYCKAKLEETDTTNKLWLSCQVPQDLSPTQLL